MSIPSNRLLSLDVFRGITVAMMVLVNNPGDWGHIYPPLEHAEWNGCTPTDLVFPFFLFIVGVAVVYALGAKKQEFTEAQLALRVLKRSLIIFLLGLFMALFPKVFYEPLATFSHVRIPGVLQRIALVYLAVGLIFLKTTQKTQAVVAAGLLLIYWVLMLFVPVPGVGPANLEKETNLGAWLDRTLLGTDHLWIQSVTWDPEGVLGTLPAIATGLTGVLAGTWIRRTDRHNPAKISWLFAAGILAVLAGRLWGFEFPINKALWTSSYVLYSSGLAAMGLGLLYWLIDVKGFRSWTRPFVVYGVNAITVFFLSGIIARSLNMIMVSTPGGAVSLKTSWYSQFFSPYFSPLNASLAWALVNVLAWLIILWVMYNKKLIIKV